MSLMIGSTTNVRISAASQSKNRAIAIVRNAPMMGRMGRIAGASAHSGPPSVCHAGVAGFSTASQAKAGCMPALAVAERSTPAAQEYPELAVWTAAIGVEIPTWTVAMMPMIAVVLSGTLAVIVPVGVTVNGRNVGMLIERSGIP